MERKLIMDPKRFLEISYKIYQHRDSKSIKNDFGKSVIIGGCKRYPLSVIIASKLCYVSANGYTALAVPDSIYTVVVSQMNPTHIIEILDNENDSFKPEQDLYQLNKYNALLFGNGVSSSDENVKFLSRLIECYENNLIIDATGLMLLSRNLDILKNKNPKSRILLTPHLGEASFLLRVKKEGRNPFSYKEEAIEFCKKYDVNMLLKSSSSLYVTSNGDYCGSDYKETVNLAKAGSGDGLAGYLVGLLSYADKIVSYDDVIIFGDHMIHIAANEAKHNLGITSSILDVPYYISSLAKGK